MKYAIIGVLAVVVVFALIESFYSKKLFAKKMAADNAYINLDDLFIERYEMIPNLFDNQNSEVLEIMTKRQSCIDSKTEIERSKYDKEMYALICDYFSSKSIIVPEEFSNICKKIEEAYSQYNDFTNDFNLFIKKPLVRPIGKFLGFSVKPIL